MGFLRWSFLLLAGIPYYLLWPGTMLPMLEKSMHPYRPPAGWIKALVNRSLRPGAIVVLHDSGGDRSSTVKALPGIIEEAHSRGLGMMKVSELLDSSP